MKSTINSVLRIRSETRGDVLATFNKFKAVQDIPCEDIECRIIDRENLELTIRYPLEVFDRTVTHFMAVLFGELPYMRGLNSLRFMRLELPEEVFAWFGGPKFGVDGIKRRFGFDEFPFLMSIIKPSVDLSRDKPAQERKLSGPLEAGFHAVKDDEASGNVGNLTVSDRVSLAARHKGYVPAINLDTYEDFELILSDERLSMVILNASIIGFPLLNRLRKITKVPILSHLSLQGTFNQSFSPGLYAFLHRLFGCDAFIIAIGDSGYYGASKQDELDMVESVTSHLPIRRTLPLLAGGARLHNIEGIMAPYERGNIPYGLVFGSLIFNSAQSPGIMAGQVVEFLSSSRFSRAKSRHRKSFRAPVIEAPGYSGAPLQG